MTTKTLIWFYKADSLKMYKISEEVINFIEKTMKDWRVELTAGRKMVKIQKGIFKGDALSSLLFIIPMMPYNHILSKCAGGYKLYKLQKTFNHLIYMDDIKRKTKKNWKL